MRDLGGRLTPARVKDSITHMRALGPKSCRREAGADSGRPAQTKEGRMTGLLLCRLRHHVAGLRGKAGALELHGHMPDRKLVGQ